MAVVERACRGGPRQVIGMPFTGYSTDPIGAQHTGDPARTGRAREPHDRDPSRDWENSGDESGVCGDIPSQ